MEANEPESSILGLPATRLIAYSNSEGRFTRTLGRAAPPDPGLAGGLDVLVAAARELGRGRAFGALRMAVLGFAEATVLVGCLPQESLVYVVTDPDSTQLGLLLSHLRALLSTAAREEALS